MKRPLFRAIRWRANLPKLRIDMTEEYFDRKTHDIAQDQEVCGRCGELTSEIIKRRLDCMVRAHVDIKGKKIGVPT